MTDRPPPSDAPGTGDPASVDPIEALLALRLAEARAALAGHAAAARAEAGLPAPAAPLVPAPTPPSAAPLPPPAPPAPPGPVSVGPDLDETAPSPPPDVREPIYPGPEPSGPTPPSAAAQPYDSDALIPPVVAQPGTDPEAAPGDTASADSGRQPAGPREGRPFGPYVLHRRLASGGLAAVFQATDARDGRPVAVKVMRPEVTPDSELARLAERSLGIARQIAHPNLVEVYEGGWHDDRRYTAMEYHEGRTLDQELVEGPLDPARGLAVLRQILEAADAIHAAGMAHHDFKPANILLVAPRADAAEAREPLVKILDLDFLGPVTERRSSREVMGTPKYLAPEEIHRGYAHPKGDLFSIGILAYEMFTGREPFRVDKEVGYLYANRFATAEPASSTRPGLPRELDRLLNGLLARQPAERYDARTALRDCRALEDAQRTPGASVALIGPPVSPRVAAGWGIAIAAAAILGVIALVSWAATGDPSALHGIAEIAPTLELGSPRARSGASAPLEAWPAPSAAASAASSREWTRARLALEHGVLPGQIEAALEAIERVAAQSTHPQRDLAAQLASERREAAFRALLAADPRRALAELARAIETARDETRRLKLQAELERLSSRAAPPADPTLPAGFVAATTAGRAAIARRPVTHLEYLAFVDSDPTAARPTSWSVRGIPPGLANTPVRGVSAQAATAFAAWRGARLPRRDELSTPTLERAGPEWVADAGRVVVGGEPATADTAVFRLVLDAGGTLNPLTLAQPRHRLRVRSSPAGAAVFIAGQRIGEAPIEVPLLTSEIVEVRLELEGSLPAVELLEPAAPDIELVLQLYGRLAVPDALRDYARNADSALVLLDHAAGLREQGRGQLAHTLVLLAYLAHADHYHVLRELRRYLDGQPRPQLIAIVNGKLAALDARVDEIRTQATSADQVWSALEALGYDRRVDMVAVPAGTFRFGSDTPRPGEIPLRTLELRAYWIDRLEVSSRDFRRFLRATRRPLPPGWAADAPNDQLDHPAVGIDYADALAYARWAGKRVPNELEWVKAARGELYRNYPWGEHFFTGYGNTGEGKLGRAAPVGAHPRDISPLGAYDLGGNVSEWTSTDVEVNLVVKPKVVLGGNFRSPRAECLVSWRSSQPPDTRRDDLGFRCASD